ncbi:MAG: DUF721 domain-containing protein [Acetobacter sp.]|nr:DUF721 domain-containing protein [Acetobacter sp.]MBR2124132.1 DUF721 domain-containing protein [Acetobacter sp.]
MEKDLKASNPINGPEFITPSVAPTTEQKEQNLSHRVYNTPRSLASLLPNVTAVAFRRRSPMEIQILTRWRDIVGAEIAALAYPKKLSAKVLTIACSGPVAMEMHYRAEMLMARINMWSGTTLVERVRIVQEPTGTKTESLQTHKPPHSKNILSLATTRTYSSHDFPKNSLGEALESLSAAIKEDQLHT